MHKITFLFLYILVLGQAFAQKNIIEIDDLNFHSDFERTCFTNESPDYFNLLLAVNPAVDVQLADEYKSRYQSLFNRISISKYLKKPNDKKIQKLYQDVHDVLFEKYEMKNTFDQVFSSGIYNCVSGTALYALLFNELNIPYSIIEKPTHVYLMAYPNQEEILVETTDPSGAFLSFNEKFRVAAVEQLKASKLVSEEDVRSKSVDAIFQEFYSSDQSIDIRQLVGLQYLNDALYNMDAGRLNYAYEQLEKAYFLYPKENLGMMLIIMNIQLLEENQYESPIAMDYLGNLSRLKQFGLTNDHIIGEFDRMTDKYLREKGDTATYTHFYNHLNNQLKDDSLQNELAYWYHLQYGYFNYKKRQFEHASPHLIKAYTLKPQNQEINDLLVSNIGNSLEFESNTFKVISRLENTLEALPDLNDHLAFKSMLVNAYLIGFGQSFDFANESKGLYYKKLFEENYESALNIHPHNIGRSYSLCAVYYFKKGYKTKALQLIEKGLSLAPDNYELLMRRRMIR